MSQVSQNLNELVALEGRWSLDPDGTTAEFHSKILRLVPVRGTIKAVEGAANVGSDGSIDGNLVLDTTTVDTGIKRRDTHLRTADFFDAERYPTIVFTAQSAHIVSSGRFEVAGSLTLHGQTRPLTTIVDIQHDLSAASISTTIELDRTHWGVGGRGPGPSTLARVVLKAHFVRV